MEKQFKVEYVDIFEEIDSFYSPKMHFSLMTASLMKVIKYLQGK